jgi:site-specific DNA-methyltransferase (adenine-specific)
MQLIHGDCLEQHENIESGSVDLILTDLPYGTMNGFNGIDWDFAIDPKKVYEIANRVLRKNGKMVLFSQEPYTGQLTTQAIPNVPFNYRMIWQKDNFANALLCNKAPVGYFEDILVFSKIYDTDLKHPVYDYADMVIEYIKKPKKQIFKEMGHQGAFHFLLGKNSFQVSLCTEKTYNQMIEMYGIDKMEGFIEYEVLKKQENQFKEKFASTFNLWEGNKYKSNILKYKKDYDGLHPTQKPILLLEDIVKTFSNEGDLVVDLTMGSGSTGIACINTKRNFIGIEKDDKYFEIAKKRIEEHLTTAST